MLCNPYGYWLAGHTLKINRVWPNLFLLCFYPIRNCITHEFTPNLNRITTKAITGKKIKISLNLLTVFFASDGLFPFFRRKK